MTHKGITIVLVLAAVTLMAAGARAEEVYREGFGLFQEKIYAADPDGQSWLVEGEKRILLVNTPQERTRIVTPAGRALKARDIRAGDWVAVRGYQGASAIYRMTVIGAQTIYVLPRRYSESELKELK